MKHLAQFPDEGIQAACSNVFDFDVYNEEASRLVVQVCLLLILLGLTNCDPGSPATWDPSKRRH